MDNSFNGLKSKLRLLILEDAPEDVILAEMEIKRVTLNYELRVATDREEFIKEMLEFSPQLIISDYSLPDFNGVMALKIATSTLPGVPFIFLTGTLESEELAAQTILNGAQGFVLKGNIKKLPDVMLACLKNFKINFEIRDQQKKLETELEVLSTEIAILFKRLKSVKTFSNPNSQEAVIGYSNMVKALNEKLIRKQILLEEKIQLASLVQLR